MEDMDDMLPFNGLRGISAVAIMLGHQTDMFLLSPFPKKKGVVGLEYLQAVSLFFLLSGIPLARLYSTTKKVHTWEGTFDFWRKRFARLAPMYYLTLVLNVAVILLCAQKVDSKALLVEFFGCAFLLQSWFTSLINVGGVLWQITVFVFGYAMFPFLSTHISDWSSRALVAGLLVLWLFSAALFCAIFVLFPAASREWQWWIWHVHCVSRLPHFAAGVLLGQLVEKLRPSPPLSAATWASVTDLLSVVLLATAVQAPLVQALYGPDLRAQVSLALEAFLLPVHALWLGAMVLAHGGGSWTVKVLSVSLAGALGDLSLVVYCLHLVVLFVYTAVLAYLRTGDRHIFPSQDDYTLRVQAAWWHAPLQWLLVLGVSVAASRWYEAPMRQWMAGRGAGKGRLTAEEKRRKAQGAAAADEEAAPLLPWAQ